MVSFSFPPAINQLTLSSSSTLQPRQHFTTKLDLASIIAIWRKNYNHMLCGPLANRLPWAQVPFLGHARVIRNKPHRTCHTAGSLGMTTAIILKPCTCQVLYCSAQQKHQESDISIIMDNYLFLQGDQSHCVYRRNEQHGRCHFSFCPSSCVLADLR